MPYISSVVIHCRDPYLMAPFWSLVTGLPVVEEDAVKLAERTLEEGESVLLHDPSGTEPGSTIRDYVRDVNAQDVAAAEALLASQHVRALLGQPDGWLTATVSITGLSLGTPEPRDGHGTPADGYLQVVFVPARLTLARSTPGSAPTGHLTWGFLLARNGMVSRWIIVDDGPTST